MNQLLHHDNTEELATLIFEKVDRAYEDAKSIDVPALTREIFGLAEGFVPNLVKLPEFNAVCMAVDFLIEEGSVWFDTRDGTVHRV